MLLGSLYWRKIALAANTIKAVSKEVEKNRRGKQKLKGKKRRQPG